MDTTSDSPANTSERLSRKRTKGVYTDPHKKAHCVSSFDGFSDLVDALPGKLNYREKVDASRVAVDMLLEDLNPHVEEQPSDDFLTRSESDKHFIEEDPLPDPTQLSAIAAIQKATSELKQKAVKKGGPFRAELAMCASNTVHHCTGFEEPGQIVPNPQEAAPIGDNICLQCGAVIEVKVRASKGGCYLLSLKQGAVDLLSSGTCPPTIFVVCKVKEFVPKVNGKPSIFQEVQSHFNIDSWSIDSSVVMEQYATFQQSVDRLGRTTIHIPKDLWTERVTKGDTMVLPKTI